MRAPRRLLLALIALVGLASDAGACPAGPSPLIFGTSERDYPPHSLNRNGAVSGFDVEVVQAALDSLGCAVEFRPLPWKRALKSLELGRIDGLLTMFRTTEREAFTWYPSEYVSREEMHFVVRAESGMRFDGDLRFLEGRTVGVYRGASYGRSFDDDLEFTRHILDTDKELVRALVDGWIDVAVGNRAAMITAARALNRRRQVKILRPALVRSPSYAGLRMDLGRGPFGPAFDQALRQVKHGPAHEALLSKYDMIEDSALTD